MIRISMGSKIILFAILCCVNFTACEEGIKQPKENQGSSITSSERTEETKIRNEMLSAKMFEKKIQIGDTVVEYPLTYKSLVDAGAKCTEDIVADSFMEAEQYLSKEFTISDTRFTVGINNNGFENKMFSEADIYAILSTDGNDLIYPCGVKTGISYEELKEKWGEPTLDISFDSDEKLILTYLDVPLKTETVMGAANKDILLDLQSVTGNKYTITIDKMTNLISDIQCIWNTGSYNKKTEIKTTYENNGELLEFKYEIPENFANNQITMDGKWMNLISAENQKYAVVIFADFILSELQGNEISYELTNPYSADDVYDLELLNDDSGEVRAIGYLDKGNMIYSVLVYAKDERLYTSYGSKLIAINDEKIGKDALEQYKKILEDIVSSISVTKIN